MSHPAVYFFLDRRAEILQPISPRYPTIYQMINSGIPLDRPASAVGPCWRGGTYTPENPSAIVRALWAVLGLFRY